MLDLPTLYRAACLPLFFLTAWGTSCRFLSARLKYRLPLSLQVRVPAIRKFWMCDLMLSAIVFVLAFFVFPTELVAGYLGEKIYSDQSLERSLALQPVLAVVLGFIWPKASALSVSAGHGGRTFNLGMLRDLLLGGASVDTVNNHLQQAVDGYVRRVAGSMPSSDGSGAGQIAQLKQRAAENLELLYLQVSEEQMIPFVDRRKLLMSVPGMTAQEEAGLYQSGVGLATLMFGRPAHGFDSVRWSELRQNARGMVKRQSAVVFGAVALALALVAAGVFVAPYMSRGLPRTDAEGTWPAPSVSSEAEARKDPALYVSGPSRDSDPRPR